MQAILSIPLEVRLIGLFLLSILLAGGLNLAIYRLAWKPRWISPWFSTAEQARTRTWKDRLPILGWWFLRRETPQHGTAFWLRPLLIELIFGLSVCWLYWWEIVARGLQLPPEMAAPPLGAFVIDDWLWIAHLQFVSHVILLMLMVVASLIDIDEWIIPDTITVPGTLIGLSLAAWLPWSLLPGNSWLPSVGTLHSLKEFLNPATPLEWPASFRESPNLHSLWIGLACWWGWCFALLPRRWLLGRGLKIALKIFTLRLIREPLTWIIVGAGLLGSLAIYVMWQWAPVVNWAGLLTALLGLAGGGGLIWLVRIIGAIAVRREAMGFGDVTLMAMVGTFIGWQAALLAFLIAPLAGLLVAVISFMVRRQREFPFGPYLCLGTAFVVVCWADVWPVVMPYFSFGWLIPVVVAVCLGAMGLMLAAWHFIEGLFKRTGEKPHA